MVTRPGKESQRAFAKAAKDTGDAINSLLTSTDNTYQRKIIDAVNKSNQANENLKAQAPVSREALVKAAQNNADKTVMLVKVVNRAAESTIDKNKAHLLKSAGESVKVLGPALIQSAKALNQSPNDGSIRERVQSQHRELQTIYDKIVEYAKMTANYVGKVGDAWENAQRLLELARQMEDAANALHNAALRGNREDFMAAAKRAAQTALELIKQAELMAAQEKDPLKKKMILSAIEELRQASRNLVNAAKEAQADPNNPEKQRKLELAHKELSEAIAKILALTDPNQSPASKFYYTAQFLENTAGTVVDEAKRGDRPALVDDAEVLSAAALQFAHECEEVSKTILDPNDRAKLLNIGGEVKTLANELRNQAGKVVLNPSDQKELKELEKQYVNLQDKLDDARRAAGFHVSRARNKQEQIQPKQDNIDFLKGENELVTAAKQQAVEALQIAEEAEKIAHSLQDQKRKKEILDACAELRDWAHKVIKAAEALSQNPGDDRLQKTLLDTQTQLTRAITKVIGLTSDVKEELTRAIKELEALLQESEQLYAEFFAACKAAQNEIKDSFAKTSGRKSPQEMVAAAKRLADHSNNISRILREMASKNQDSVYKQQLTNCSKLVRDRAIQVKMISAVKVAMTGDDVDDNQVVSAATGVDTEINEVVKMVKAGILKFRLQQTQKQTLAIKKIRELWSEQRKKLFNS